MLASSGTSVRNPSKAAFLNFEPFSEKKAIELFDGFVKFSSENGIKFGARIEHMRGYVVGTLTHKVSHAGGFSVRLSNTEERLLLIESGKMVMKKFVQNHGNVIDEHWTELLESALRE